jgi:hypothetical protein
MPDYIDDPKIARNRGILPGIEPDDGGDPKIARAGGVLPRFEPDDGGDPGIARMRAITLQQRGTGFPGTNESRPTPQEKGLAPRVDRPAKRVAKTGRGRSSVEAVKSNPVLKAEITPASQPHWLVRFVREVVAAWMVARRGIDKDFMPKGSPTEEVRKKAPKKDEEEDDAGPGPSSGPDPDKEKELKKAADLAATIVLIGVISAFLTTEAATSNQ